MALTGWGYPSLFGELARLQDEFMREWRPGQLQSSVFPQVNIYDDGESFLVRSEMPGVDKGSLDIQAKGDQLTIRGERVVRPAGDSASYHRREREGGQFRRIVTLPERVNADKVNATYSNGVLQVVLPRAAEAQTRKISVS